MVTNGRRNRNLIFEVAFEGCTFKGDKDIGQAFTTSFGAQFGTKRDNCLLFDWSVLLANKPRINLEDLESPFSVTEIKMTTMELGAEKALGPDGFLILFFQKYWSIIERDMVKLCNDFHNHFDNLERINWANIVILPKTDALAAVSDYCPISLINAPLKFIYKMLSTRLSKVIDRLVDNSQSTFIKGR